MGIRSRTSRDYRKRQKERARARRRAQLMLARPPCPECEALLTRDGEAPDLWSCDVCEARFMRLGVDWLVSLGETPAAQQAA